MLPLLAASAAGIQLACPWPHLGSGRRASRAPVAQPELFPLQLLEQPLPGFLLGQLVLGQLLVVQFLLFYELSLCCLEGLLCGCQPFGSSFELGLGLLLSIRCLFKELVCRLSCIDFTLEHTQLSLVLLHSLREDDDEFIITCTCVLSETLLGSFEGLPDTSDLVAWVRPLL